MDSSKRSTTFKVFLQINIELVLLGQNGLDIICINDNLYQLKQIDASVL